VTGVAHIAGRSNEAERPQLASSKDQKG